MTHLPLELLLELLFPPPLFFILFSVSLQPFAANLVLTPILWLVGFGAATAQSFGLTPHLQRHCAFTVGVWSERLVAEAANKSKGWVCVCVCVCVGVCVTVWDHVEVQVSVKGVDSLCHCVLESSLKAHYAAGFCELLVCTISRKSASTPRKAARALLLSDRILKRANRTLLSPCFGLPVKSSKYIRVA